MKWKTSSTTQVRGLQNKWMVTDVLSGGSSSECWEKISRAHSASSLAPSPSPISSWTVSQLLDYLPQSRLPFPSAPPRPTWGSKARTNHCTQVGPGHFNLGEGAPFTKGQGSFQLCRRHQPHCDSITCGLGDNKACRHWALSNWGGCAGEGAEVTVYPWEIPAVCHDLAKSFENCSHPANATCPP